MNVTETMSSVEALISDNRIELNKMQVLSPFHGKMQKFQGSLQSQSSTITSLGYNQTYKILIDLIKCNTKIKSKRYCIQKLKSNLKYACSVSKTLALQKKQSGPLKLNIPRVQNVDLLQEYKNNIKIMKNMTKEHKSLQNILNNFENCIQLGYKELQNMRHEDPEETSVLAQLRKLIISSGRHYADYRNEHDKYLLLKQKNRFLRNKIIVLEYNIQTLSEQVRTLKYRNNRIHVSQKENGHCKSKRNETAAKNDTQASLLEFKAETKLPTRNTNFNKSVTDSKNSRQTSDLNLSPHILIVQKLLSDQDILLGDLQVLSQEFLNIAT